MLTNSKKIYNLLLSLLILAITTLFSCKKVDELLTFQISNESAATISRTNPLNLPFNVITPNVTTNSSQQFQNNNSNVNKVKDIKLKNLKLTITNPTTQTFSFLKSIRLYISTNTSNEIEIAYLEDINSTASVIELTTTEAKLDEYIKADKFSLRMSVVTKQNLTQDVDIKINSIFNVTANL